MIERLMFLVVLLGIAPVGDAKTDDPAAASPPETGKAMVVAAGHVRNFMEGKFAKLADTYAARIQLAAGHEMLKAEYGLAGDGARAKGATVDRAKLLAAMKKAFGGRPVVPPEVLEKVLAAFEFQVLESGIGDQAVDSPDPVDTPDGKTHFMIKPGDVLLKFAPKNGKGDFLLFQLRREAGSWKVVGELLD